MFSSTTRGIVFSQTNTRSSVVYDTENESNELVQLPRIRDTNVCEYCKVQHSSSIPLSADSLHLLCSFYMGLTSSQKKLVRASLKFDMGTLLLTSHVSAKTKLQVVQSGAEVSGRTRLCSLNTV